LYDALKTGMSPNVDIKSHGERTLVDWVSISGALLFAVLMCFCIVLFARGANQLATTQAEALLRVPIPVAISQPPRAESTLEAEAKSVTSTTQRESYHIAFISPSVDSSSRIPSQPTKQTKSRGAMDELATANSKSAYGIRAHRRNLSKIRVKNHQRSTFRAIALRFLSRISSLVADD
jgi:hypothetical protein